MKVKLCYFNNHWNVYLFSNTDFDWKDKTLKTSKNERGEFRLREYKHPEITVFSFGFMCHNPVERPGHGGEWSSNSKAINEVFGTDLIEVALDNVSCAVSLKWLKELLGDKVIWEPDDIYGHWITEIPGTEKEWMVWKEINI